MSEHYFSEKPAAEHRPLQFQAELRGRLYSFHTDAGVFSRQGIDAGSRLLIESFPGRPGDIILDLGCGYGPIGIAAADLAGPSGYVYLVDVNQRAVELAAGNLAVNGITNGEALISDGLQALPGQKFHWVLCNPPVRAGKKTVYSLLSEAFEALYPQGCLLVVIRTKQGAKSLYSFLEDLAGNCETVSKKSGFRVLKCCKLLPA